jgi:hypothetical protein
VHSTVHVGGGRSPWSLSRNSAHSSSKGIEMENTLLMVLCIVAILASGCATPHSDRTVWEYKVLTGYVPSDIEKQLNALGQEGWIVVSSTTVANGPTPVYIFLKRHK